jgi:hypothetical protein
MDTPGDGCRGGWWVAEGGARCSRLLAPVKEEEDALAAAMADEEEDSVGTKSVLSVCCCEGDGCEGSAAESGSSTGRFTRILGAMAA